jgi:hypothetical protein
MMKSFQKKLIGLYKFFIGDNLSATVHCKKCGTEGKVVLLLCSSCNSFLRDLTPLIASCILLLLLCLETPVLLWKCIPTLSVVYEHLGMRHWPAVRFYLASCHFLGDWWLFLLLLVLLPTIYIALFYRPKTQSGPNLLFMLALTIFTYSFFIHVLIILQVVSALPFLMKHHASP